MQDVDELLFVVDELLFVMDELFVMMMLLLEQFILFLLRFAVVGRLLIVGFNPNGTDGGEGDGGEYDGVLSLPDPDDGLLQPLLLLPLGLPLTVVVVAMARRAVNKSVQ